MGLLDKKNISVTDITPEVIERWKRQHGNIYQISLEDKVGFFRELNKQDFKQRNLKKMVGKNAYRTGFNTLKIAWLGGDKEFITERDFILCAFNELESVFEKKALSVNSNLKKYF
jgi:5'(3')-deoxyribonucleotidase